MKIKGAMTILNKRCEFYGRDLNWLIGKVDNGWDEIDSVIRAIKVYKMHLRHIMRDSFQALTLQPNRVKLYVQSIERENYDNFSKQKI